MPPGVPPPSLDDPHGAGLGTPLTATGEPSFVAGFHRERFHASAQASPVPWPRSESTRTPVTRPSTPMSRATRISPSTSASFASSGTCISGRVTARGGVVTEV